MADHFLTKLRVAPGDFIQANGSSALEAHAGLKALLEDRAGPEVAALFAEPLVSHGNDTAAPAVSWYADRPGDAHVLSDLAPGERAAAERYLADHLRPVYALAQDPTHGALVRAALATYGDDDILMVGDRPVIVNWGLMPGGRVASDDAVAAQSASTLGRFTQAVPARPKATQSPEPIRNAPPLPANPARLPTIAWLPLVILLVLAGAVLVWLLLPGTRMFFAEERAVSISDEAELAAVRAQNAALRARRASLEAALNEAVCRADGQLILPGGLTPEGLVPPALGSPVPDKAEAAPDAVLPTDPSRIATGVDEETLLELIAARTVLVMSKGVSTEIGSGLVIGPGLVVTNYHVIQGALEGGGRILVTNDRLGSLQRAEILKAEGPFKETGVDFALLRIEDTKLPAFAVLRADRPLALTNVIAAGFPADVLDLDPGFATLAAGHGTTGPAITVTDGIVNTEQSLGPRTHVVMHSAALSGGNSGGPLVDTCGRLVGVNAFLREGELQTRGYALSTDDLVVFLRGTEADPAIVSEPCAPIIMRPKILVAPATDDEVGATNSDPAAE